MWPCSSHPIVRAATLVAKLLELPEHLTRPTFDAAGDVLAHLPPQQKQQPSKRSPPMRQPTTENAAGVQPKS